MHDLRQRHCPISTSKHAKKTSGCRVTHSSHGTYSYVPSVRVLSVRSAWTAQPCSKSEKRVSGTCGRRWASGTGRGPNLSKVGASARNARCEADNFNSDRPEGGRRGAVYSHISKSAFAPSTGFGKSFLHGFAALVGAAMCSAF